MTSDEQKILALMGIAAQLTVAETNDEEYRGADEILQMFESYYEAVEDRFEKEVAVYAEAEGEESTDE